MLADALIQQSMEMQGDLDAWVPYSFGPLFNFHLPPAAQGILGVCDAGQAAAALLPLLRGESAPSECWPVVMLAAETLGCLGSSALASSGSSTAEALLEALLACTEHTHWWVRRSAFEAAGRLRLTGGPLSTLAERVIHSGSHDENFLVRRRSLIATESY
jgi:hypothetical protein